jgi:hypothetical protein
VRIDEKHKQIKVKVLSAYEMICESSCANAPIASAPHTLALNFIVALAQTRRVGHHEWVPLDIQRYLKTGKYKCFQYLQNDKDELV